jgi:hypothetical protein
MDLEGAGGGGDAGGGDGAAAANQQGEMAQLIAGLQQIVNVGLQNVHRPVLNKPPMFKQGQDFQLWLERFNLYLDEVNIPALNRRAELMKFLDLDGAFRVVHSMDLVAGLTYEQFCGRLANRFALYRTADDAKMAFMARNQLTTESIEDFADFLAKLAREAYPEPIYNGQSRAEQVFERFRHGVRTTPDVRERLFTERPAGVQGALELVRNVELGRRQLVSNGHSLDAGAQLRVTREELQEMCHQVSMLKKQVLQPVPAPNGQGVGRPEGSPLCLYCGAVGHYAAVCPAQQGLSQVSQQGGVRCFNCSGSGHFARNCPQKQQGAGRTPMVGGGVAGSGWRQSGPGLACFRCGGAHILRFCPLEAAQAPGNANGRSVLDGSRPARQQDRQ